MEIVRETIRNQKLQERDNIRQSLLNKNRNLENQLVWDGMTEDELVKTAVKLKTKSCVTREMLASLKHAFLQNKEFIGVFIKVDGAIQSLVRELSGHRASHQLESAYCISNLAMTDEEKLVLRIIQAAGPYLLSMLDIMNLYLIEACCWAVGNLSNHGERCVSALKNLGVFPKLVSLLTHQDSNVSVAALYTTSLIIYNAGDTLSAVEIEPVVSPALSIYKKDPASSSYLLFLLSCHQQYHEQFIQNGIHVLTLTRLTEIVGREENEETLKDITANIRIIGNLVRSLSSEEMLMLVTLPHQSGVMISHVVNEVLRTSHEYLLRECLWFVGNLMTHPCPNVFSVLCNVLAEVQPSLCHAVSRISNIS